MVINSQEEAMEYLKTWKSSISNSLLKQMGKEINEISEIEEAFQEMQKSWMSSFKDSTDIEKIMIRDKNILSLGRVISQYIKQDFN
ncbi:MAG: hypothetical protein CL565_04580 [Alphaproteobacteria bacterium]|nr:hypothetical protein [Alphaproteobacteria bacterium]|tara:strand:- start:1111 stop:1368 length:258 start_codon:yes stop_codon:yes gene_type:complete